MPPQTICHSHRNVPFLLSLLLIFSLSWFLPFSSAIPASVESATSPEQICTACQHLLAEWRRFKIIFDDSLLFEESLENEYYDLLQPTMEFLQRSPRVAPPFLLDLHHLLLEVKQPRDALKVAKLLINDVLYGAWTSYTLPCETTGSAMHVEKILRDICHHFSWIKDDEFVRYVCDISALFFQVPEIKHSRTLISVTDKKLMNPWLCRENPRAWTCMNPSLVQGNGQVVGRIADLTGLHELRYVVNVRITNYQQDRGTQYSINPQSPLLYIMTENVLLFLDQHFNVLRETPIVYAVDNLPFATNREWKIKNKVRGNEDLRFSFHNDSFWALAVRVDASENRLGQMTLLRINLEGQITAISLIDHGKFTEKNWLPWVLSPTEIPATHHHHESENLPEGSFCGDPSWSDELLEQPQLFAIYSHDPLKLLRFTNLPSGDVQVAFTKAFLVPNFEIELRGSAPPSRYTHPITGDSGWLTIVHLVDMEQDRYRHYTARLVFIKDDFEQMLISAAFSLCEEQISFVGGFELDSVDGSFLVTGSCDDRSAFVGRVSSADVYDLWLKSKDINRFFQIF